MSAAGSLLYLDSSALVKLVVRETETESLEQLVATFADTVSSVVAAIEVPRVARRSGAAEVESWADRLVGKLDLLELEPSIVREAARIEPRTLRALDAIHLASALSLGGELDAIAVYDDRLAAAASAAGLQVLSPGC